MRARRLPLQLPLRALALWACLAAWGCRVPEPFQKPADQLKREVHALREVLVGRRSPLAPGASPSPAADDPSEQVRLARANGELLQEMVRVVTLRPPGDRAAFGTLVDTLNQGASVEGIYNGFTHSADYRELERSSPAAAPSAVIAFADELAWLEAELPEPTAFTEAARLPLAMAVEPTAENPAADDAPAPRPSRRPARAELLKEYARLFRGASVFTLKRVLGDEALRVIEEKRRAPGALAKWYGGFAGRLAERKVDFGLALRNRPDEKFHYEWAKARLAEPRGADQLTWETLNRLHRVLNSANVRAGSAE
jgi:hypothetical protein